MQTLLEQSKAYRLVKTERTENRLSHAYLLVYDDARNLRYALKTFAKLFFQEEIGVLDSRKEKLIDMESFSDCLIFPTEADKPAAPAAPAGCCSVRLAGRKAAVRQGDFPGAQ